MNKRIRKATTHTNQNEGLIFEKSSPGKRAFELPPLDVPAADPAKALGANYRREGVEGFPEVSEIEVLRHFTRLSTWNYAIDLGMYPLGSCTMKYNPRMKVLIPDSAHGTNPATAVIAGYEVENIKSESHGQIDVEKLRELVTEDVAALMITNPSTLGIFE